MGDCGWSMDLWEYKEREERERLQNTAQLARNPALRKRLPQQGEKSYREKNSILDTTACRNQFI